MLNSFADGLMRITYVIGAACIALMMIHVTLHVLALYVFSFPMPGTYLVVSNYYMVIVTFLCIGLAERKNAHISVDFLYEIMPRGLQNICSAIASFLTISVFAVMGYRGFENALSKTKSGTYDLEYGIKFITWPAYYLVPIGSAIVVAVVLLKIINKRPAQ